MISEERLKELEYCETRAQILEKMRIELGNELAAKQLALEEALKLLDKWTSSRLFLVLEEKDQEQICQQIVKLQEAFRGTGLGDAFASRVKNWQEMYDSVNKRYGKLVGRFSSFQQAHKLLAKLVLNIPTDELIAAKNSAVEIMILEENRRKSEED